MTEDRPMTESEILLTEIKDRIEWYNSRPTTNNTDQQEFDIGLIVEIITLLIRLFSNR